MERRHFLSRVLGQLLTIQRRLDCLLQQVAALDKRRCPLALPRRKAHRQVALPLLRPRSRLALAVA